MIISKHSVIKHTCSWGDKLRALWTLNRQTKIFLCILNANLVLNLCTDVVPQSIITLIASFSSIKLLFHCLFFGLSSSSYLCFLWFECYLVISHKSLWSNPSFCFLFNHNIPSLSTTFFMLCIDFHSLYQAYFHSVFYISIVCSAKVSGFLISSFISYILLFFETNLSWLIYETIKTLEIRTSIASNLVFPNNTFLSCFFFFFLIIDLYILILAVTANFLFILLN